MIYYTKNKVRRQRKFHNSLYGVQLIKDIRLYSEMCPDFKRDYEERLNSKKNKKERAERSIRRTRMNIQRTLEANLDNKSYFLTLTFKEEINDYEKANQRFNYWVRIKNKNLKYLVIKELQNKNRDNVIHYHLIVFDCEDINKLAESWSYGFSYIKKIDNFYSYSISSYLTKYLTKDKNQLVHKEKKIFSKSRNLKKPLILTSNVISQILDIHGINTDLMAFDYLQYDYIIKDTPNVKYALSIKS